LFFIRITASPFVAFHLAIVLCVIRITQYNGQMKRDKWGSCNLNDIQYV
jgi:hypothetical protein